MTTPRRAWIGRGGAAAVALLWLLVTSVAQGSSGLDRASFDAATSCGADGIVTLWVEEASQGCGDRYAIVRVEGGPAAGLPSVGDIDWGGSSPVQFPGDQLLAHRFALHGDGPCRGRSRPSRWSAPAAPSAPPATSSRSPATARILGPRARGPSP